MEKLVDPDDIRNMKQKGVKHVSCRTLDALENYYA